MIFDGKVSGDPGQFAAKPARTFGHLLVRHFAHQLANQIAVLLELIVAAAAATPGLRELFLLQCYIHSLA